MPNSVSRSTRHYLNFVCCLLLLFFIPLKIEFKNDEAKFQEYISKFNKSYNSSEYYQRLEAFKHSLRNIESLNNQINNTALYGFTKFSDMLPEEFLLPDLTSQLKRILLPEDVMFLQIDDNNVKKIKQIKNIPEKVDWRERKAVTEIKNQKSCSGCWAFAAVGIIESQDAIKNGNLNSLSVQNVIDCAPFDGCDGGNVCLLLSWMKVNRFKIYKEKDYPLTLVNGKCRNNGSSDGVYINNFICKDLVGSEENILKLLAFNGPVAVAINALSWQNYIGGIIQFHCNGNPSKLNHAVEIVGYDLTKDVPHYIIKNSWGTDFGDNGYLYIAIGKNMCGLAYEVAAVTL